MSPGANNERCVEERELTYFDQKGQKDIHLEKKVNQVLELPKFDHHTIIFSRRGTRRSTQS